MSIDNRGVLFLGAPTRSDLPSLRSLWTEAFGDTEEFLDSFFLSVFSPERCRVIKDGETVAASLYILDCEARGKKIAYIYAVATRKSHRKKGLCKKLVENTHEYLSKRGYAAAILVPSNETLFDFYGKMGYKVCSRVSEFEALASQADIEVRPIDKKEYAALRGRYLPKNGVLQANESIDFLSSFAELYCGENFVLAAYKRGDRLVCAELLGDSEKARGILSALGCREGRFRTPPMGEARDFAMAYSLDGEAVEELYFGLAFD